MAKAASTKILDKREAEVMYFSSLNLLTNIRDLQYAFGYLSQPEIRASAPTEQQATTSSSTTSNQSQTETHKADTFPVFRNSLQFFENFYSHDFNGGSFSLGNEAQPAVALNSSHSAMEAPRNASFSTEFLTSTNFEFMEKTDAAISNSWDYFYEKIPNLVEIEPGPFGLQTEVRKKSVPKKRRKGLDVNDNTSCYHCKTKTTPEWRTGPEGHLLCNACGLKWSRGLMKKKLEEANAYEHVN